MDLPGKEGGSIHPKSFGQKKGKLIKFPPGNWEQGKMTKLEHQLKLAEIGVQKLQIWLAIPRLILICITVLSSIYFIFEGIKPVISQNADSITAFAKVIDALKLGNILAWMITALATIGYVFERKGKQRAIQQKARYQQIAEKSDDYRSSSNMNETGTSPKQTEASK